MSSPEAAPPLQLRFPTVSVAIVAVVLLTAAAQALIPGWYATLARDGLATEPGQWWRVVTALFAYDAGSVQVLSIVVGAALLGVVGETQFGPLRWLILFVVAGLFGQVVAVSWQPMGAGSSVAVAGQLGAVAIWAILPATPVPPFARLGPVIVLAGAVALVIHRDIHGPPVLLGAALGFLFLVLRRS